MAQVGAPEIGLQMQQDPDAQRCRAVYLELTSAQQRDIAEAERARCLSRKARVDVIGGGEDHRDDVVVIDPGPTVTYEHVVRLYNYCLRVGVERVVFPLASTATTATRM